MMAPDEILDGLARIVAGNLPLAFFWHVATALVAIRLYTGWRPRAGAALGLLALPIASVSALAWTHGNPFNGTSFAALAVILASFAFARRSDEIGRGPTWSTAMGVVMIAFAWAYPHFLEGHTPLVYLYAAPLGLIPCPTLSLAIGVMLLGGMPRSRALSLVLAGAGLAYALIGTIVLRVGIDVVLGAGAIALLTNGLRTRTWRPSLR